MRERLEGAGLDPKAASALLDDLTIDVVFDGMPVQDAVNYATFILRTTIDYTTFSMTLSPYGGPLQVAMILPDKSFQWLAKPKVPPLRGVHRSALKERGSSLAVNQLPPDFGDRLNEQRVLTTPGVAEGFDHANKIIENWKQSL